MAGSRLPGDGNFELSVRLLPCGDVEKTALTDLAQSLSAQGITVTMARPEPLPPQAFDPRRRQYRAEQILAIAGHRTAERVLVVTDCDLFSDNLNFVFGVAERPGKHAVISLFRLRMGANQDNFRRRALKEAVHELGHTLGLDHCANPRCVMYFSNCLEETDRKDSFWCVSCDGKLNRYHFGRPGRAAVGNELASAG